MTAFSLGDQERSDFVYIHYLHSFLQTPNAKQSLPNLLQQINSISENVNKIPDKDNITETNAGKRDKWMIFADLKFNTNEATVQPCVSQTEINLAEDWSLYTTKKIGYMPHWIDQEKMLLYRKEMQHQYQLKLTK